MKKYIINIIIVIAVMLLFCRCKSHYPYTIYSERECDMQRTELVEIISNILKMNNFIINFADTNMISAISEPSKNFDFNPILNARARAEEYYIKWDFIISKSTNNTNKYKVVATCLKISNTIKANISLTNPAIKYNENTFPVGQYYIRGKMYSSIIDALRHICGLEVEYYKDKYDRPLIYNIEENKFYLY